MRRVRGVRRFLLAVLALVAAAAGAGAAPVTPERALAVADRFLNGATKTGGRTLRLVWRGEKPAEAPLAEPAYYVYNADGGGFVIVAGDDAVTPVLAYSREGFFETEGMPENLADWMDGLRTCILQVRADGRKPTPAVAEAWASASGPARAGDEVVIETALWNQRDPYNRLCPQVDGGRSVTGCVATAIAIVMRHYGYPAAGHGSLPDYVYETDTGRRRTQEGHLLGETYQWDKMPLKYVSGRFTDEEADAVARLMFDVGVMMEMEYNPTGSGAYTQVAHEKLARYMDYDAGARMLEKGYFSNQEWLAMIREEIDAGRPLLYSGYDREGGHAFVADGYNSDGYIRFNWGWGGAANGFFALTDMDGFTEGNLAVFGLVPDQGNEAPNGAPGYTNISTSATIARNTDFNLVVRGIVGVGTTFSGQMAIGKYDNAGVLRELVSNPLNFRDLGVMDDQSRRFTCNIAGAIYPGDCLRPCYRESKDSDDWRPALFNAEYGGSMSISLASEDLLAQNASLRFDSYTRVLTLLSAYDSVTCRFTAPDGTDLSDRVAAAPAPAAGGADPGVAFTIPTDGLPAGTYTLTLTLGALSCALQLAL